MERKYTLRDVRRLLARGKNVTSVCSQHLPAKLDRLISILGLGAMYDRSMHNYLCDRESIDSFRPKGADAVAPATLKSDGALHGGDGNSGECDHAAQTAAQRHVTACLDSTEQSGDQGEEERSSRLRTDGDVTELYPTMDAATEQGADLPRDGALGGSDDQVRDESAAACETTKDLLRDEFDATDDDDEAASINVTPRRSYGGMCATEVASMRVDRRAALEVQRSLQKLISGYDVSPQAEDKSPRYSARRLSVEVVSKRFSLSRARREEITKQICVLICDCSGSCSATCNETLAACMAISKGSNGRVVTLVTSNDLVCEGDNPTITEWISRYQKDVSIGLVVAFGDWDGGYEYQRLCESGADLVWLDSYCCNYGVKPATRRLRSPARLWKRQPLAWWQGVGCAKSAAIAFRNIIRMQPSL